jgi:hypothetical protein
MPACCEENGEKRVELKKEASATSYALASFVSSSVEITRRKLLVQDRQGQGRCYRAYP